MRVLLLILFLLIPSISRADITTGLIGWWKFDEGTGTTAADSSNTGNTGALLNSPTWVAGKIGPFALNFVTASSQCVSAGVTSIVNTSNPLTYSAWVNLNASGSGTTREIIDVENAGASTANQFRVNSSNQLDCSRWGGGENITTAGTVSTGTWHMLTWTWDGTNSILYIDAVNSASNTTVPQSASPLHVYIGCVNDSGEFAWGNEDDARVYNRALTAQDVRQLFNWTINSVKYYNATAI